MMGVVCVPEACAVYTRVYTEEEKKRKKKEKKKKNGKIVKAKVWSSDSSAISQSKVLCIRVCDSFFYFNLSHFCSFSLSLFFLALISTYL